MSIIFFATLIRSAFGFGEALIAVPLPALIMPLNVAAPLAVLPSISIATVVVVQDWRHIHLRSTAGLLTATVFGIPIGLLLLTHARQDLVKAGLGILIMLFAVYCLLSPGTFRVERESRPLLLLVGFLAGILGGAYGMNGPPLVVYGALRRWSSRLAIELIVKSRDSRPTFREVPPTGRIAPVVEGFRRLRKHPKAHFATASGAIRQHVAVAELKG